MMSRASGQVSEVHAVGGRLEGQAQAGMASSQPEADADSTAPMSPTAQLARASRCSLGSVCGPEFLSALGTCCGRSSADPRTRSVSRQVALEPTALGHKCTDVGHSKTSWSRMCIATYIQQLSTSMFGRKCRHRSCWSSTSSGFRTAKCGATWERSQTTESPKRALVALATPPSEASSDGALLRGSWPGLRVSTDLQFRRRPAWAPWECTDHREQVRRRWS